MHRQELFSYSTSQIHQPLILAVSSQLENLLLRLRTATFCIVTLPRNNNHSKILPQPMQQLPNVGTNSHFKTNLNISLFDSFCNCIFHVLVLESEGNGRNLVSDIYGLTSSTPWGGRLQLDVIHRRQSNQPIK